MTTHPEAAMTREQVLEEALRSAIKIADEAREEWDKAPSGMKAGKLLIALSGNLSGYRHDIDAVHAALASAQQEPAPAADAEESTAWAMFWSESAGEGLTYEHAQKGFHAGWTAALRRYAGDGVTDAMVEAAYEQWINDREAVNFGVSCVDVLKAHLRRALEAAARASGEKGGAG